MQRAHIFVTGTVQGVWFRESAKQLATQLNLTGWVQNLPDGRVEAVVEGTDFAVKAMVAWCHRGPDRAVVRHVDARLEAASGEFSQFDVRR